MSFDDIAIRVSNLSKRFEIYDHPRDRLKQFVLPHLQRLGGRAPNQYFREFWALNDVSFEIRKGETVGIIGRNGSGKSTLLQMICGTLAPTTGAIEVNGRVAALLELGSGFNPEFTGRENVFMNAGVLGLSRQETLSRLSDIEAFADIGEFIDQPVKSYSSGMMVRLAFAVIAHVDADILIIDEALAVGDAFFTQKCMRFLRTFMQTGTVLFVSHDTAAVRSLCSQAIWLEKGKVLQQGSPKEVCELYLEAFYEAQQGKGTTTKLRVTEEHQVSGNSAQPKDSRLELINASNLRNDLRVFEFRPEGASFGTGGAQIKNVRLLDQFGVPLIWIVGGEQVALQIEAVALETLHFPIVGFTLKDRLGQSLFGDNTYLTYCDSSLSCEAGNSIIAEFIFRMPILPVGDYSINVAIATGTQVEHTQQDWVHDAVMIRSEASSVSTGLVGIPMQEIKLSWHQN